MEYPLVLGGKNAGTLRVHQEGLFTVFEAHCRPCNEILRLSVYGHGKEGYLGIMQPCSGGMYLRRSFSRSRMKDFPEKIEYAAPAGALPENAAPKTADIAPDKSDSGQCWYRYSDGSLVCREGGSFLIALPANLRSPSPGTVLREINGQLYMVFRY